MVCKHFTDGGSWGYKKWLHGFLHGRKVGKHWDRVMTFERKHLTIFYDFRLRGEFTVCKQHLPGPHTALKGYYTVYLLWQGEGRSITSVPYSSCKNVILNSMNTIYFDLVTLFFTTQRSFMICYLHLTVLGWFKWRTDFCLFVLFVCSLLKEETSWENQALLQCIFWQLSCEDGNLITLVQDRVKWQIYINVVNVSVCWTESLWPVEQLWLKFWSWVWRVKELRFKSLDWDWIETLSSPHQSRFICLFHLKMEINPAPEKLWVLSLRWWTPSKISVIIIYW